MAKKQVFILFLLFLVIEDQVLQKALAKDEFIHVNGVHLTLNGKPFYGNGFNTHWLMTTASNPYERSKVTKAFEEAVGCNLTIGRTMACSDGGSNPLQSSPGIYNENMFQALDLVISEAKKFGVKLILSLVNNWTPYGGKVQYVQWAKERGEDIPNDDGFFTNSLVKSFYKDNIKTVLTRVNTITKIAYKDDPTIMAWELMNEPRCTSDLSGDTVHGWIAEMVPYLKSIDNNHLLVVGSEGFYGPSSLQKNPHNVLLGVDFLRENQIEGVDFAAFHAYSHPWLADPVTQTYPDIAVELEFLKTWVNDHIQDAQQVLKKPILLTEWGKSLSDPGCDVTQRDALLNVTYSAIYDSASSGGAAVGGQFWQQLVDGMDSYRDGYEIILTKPSTTVKLISDHAEKQNHLRSSY